MRRLTVAMVFVVALVFALAGSSVASAAEGGWWSLSQRVVPTYLQPGQEAQIVVDAFDLGDTAVMGTHVPVKITDTLPAGVEPISAYGMSGSFNLNTYEQAGRSKRGPLVCSVVGQEASCSWVGKTALQPYELLEEHITVRVTGAAVSGEKNAMAISGGQPYLCREVPAGTGKYPGSFCGASINEREEELPETNSFESEIGSTPVPGVSAEKALVVREGATPFGASDFGFTLENEGGTADTQAGSHPFQWTTTLLLNQAVERGQPPAQPKEVDVNLPPGLIGNATTIEQCTESEFATRREGSSEVNFCPPGSAVGAATVIVEAALSRSKGGIADSSIVGAFTVPVFNLVPAPGEPARFGYAVEKTPILINTSVRTGSNYGIVAKVENIPQISSFYTNVVTLWGVPGAPQHNISRGWNCLAAGGPNQVPSAPCKAPELSHDPPFLSLPTSCPGVPLETSVETLAWNQPAGTAREVSTPGDFGQAMETLDGCNKLSFGAGLEVSPDVQAASTPTGLKVKVKVPQEASLSPGGLSGADVKDTTVTFPEGVTLNPSGANGLEACSNGEIGYQGVEGGSGTQLFTPSVPEPLSPGLNLGALGFCPNASKIGTAKITLPILAHPLEGAVYLASQNENPFGSLVALYIVAEDPVSGVLVKLPGEVSLNPVTGQITSTFKNTPQAPFEDLELEMFGGERAPLSTPTHCGAYTTNAVFTPWSGNAPVSSSSTFDVTSGPNGSACPSAGLPFSPSLTAGTTNNNAGAFSPLSTTIGREDGQQSISQIQLKMPPGLSGILADVPLCGEEQANAGTCGSGSQIGSTIVSVGLGGDPYSVTGGKVYLTGPYDGAPFGLSIVNPAVAGPFNLGTVVVRASIAVDPHTAALTITTGEIPHILDGIPLEIKHVNVTIERPGFTFNPTSCSQLKIEGSVNSLEGGSSPVSVPFQVANCANLKFAPKFAVSTPGHTSKADGAGLTAKLSYPTAAQGTQANISLVKVDLPKQLPSRLIPTLQGACLAKVFEADPADCPQTSMVGYATVHTPLLPVPLSGPAIFVSHGGEAFPSLTMVLQGYGVTIDLVGTTFISKAGITSTTFKTVPDVPFNTFELTLGEGPHSALAANLPETDDGNLCGQDLEMPTAFIAQNGQEIHQDTPISIEGCSKTLTITHHSTHNKTITLAVYVPAAGKLKASGPGLSTVSRTTTIPDTVTLKLTQKHAGKLKTRIKLTYTPTTGHPQTKTLTTRLTT
jgi:hypothetical protein